MYGFKNGFFGRQPETRFTELKSEYKELVGIEGNKEPLIIALIEKFHNLERKQSFEPRDDFYNYLGACYESLGNLHFKEKNFFLARENFTKAINTLQKGTVNAVQGKFSSRIEKWQEKVNKIDELIKSQDKSANSQEASNVRKLRKFKLNLHPSGTSPLNPECSARIEEIQIKLGKEFKSFLSHCNELRVTHSTKNASSKIVGTFIHIYYNEDFQELTEMKSLRQFTDSEIELEHMIERAVNTLMQKEVLNFDNTEFMKRMIFLEEGASNQYLQPLNEFFAVMYSIMRTYTYLFPEESEALKAFEQKELMGGILKQGTKNSQVMQNIYEQLNRMMDKINDYVEIGLQPNAVDSNRLIS